MAWHKRDFAKLFAKASIFGIAMLAGITNVSADLLLYYDFNTPGTTDEVPDVSGKGNNGLRMGTEYTGPGGGRTGAANDRAMDFLTHADAAYVDIPSAGDGAFDSITDKDAFTISVWLKGSDELPKDGTVLWFAGGNERQIIAHVPWSDSVIYFDMAGCDSCLFQEETDQTKFKGQWNHYAFVKNGEKAAVYQNGKVWIETEGRTPMDSITTARFGTFARDTFPYSGLMDDIAIWNEALTDKAIAGLAAGDSPIGGGLKGDFNGDKKLDVLDIDALTVEVLSGKNTLKYDVNNDKLVTDADRGVWVRDLRRTYFGDANLDGVFSSSDFVLVFQTGKYEDATPRNAGWADGDWNGDADFTSGDFVTAFQDGGFEKGPRAAVSAVPEPSAVALLGLGMATLITRRRRSR